MENTFTSDLFGASQNENACGFPLSRDRWKNLMMGKNGLRVPFLIFHLFEQILNFHNLQQFSYR